MEALSGVLDRGPARPPAVRALGWVVIVILGILGLFSCSRGPADPAPESAAGPELDRQAYRIVSTTGMITDVTTRIAGPRAAVHGIMGPGTDPHSYNATPGDLRRLRQADIIFFNGLYLEGKMEEIFADLARRGRTVVAVTRDLPRERLHEADIFGTPAPDPHVWFDVELWRIATRTVYETLKAHDPAGEAGYTSRWQALDRELADLDREIRTELARVPEARRVLITSHDAFNYFGRAYGFEVIGIQGISTASEAGARDIAATVDRVIERRIPAVFVESSVPTDTIEAVIEGARTRKWTVRNGGTLFSDAMGPADSPGGTYPGMVRHNVRQIVEALKE